MNTPSSSPAAADAATTTARRLRQLASDPALELPLHQLFAQLGSQSALLMLMVLSVLTVLPVAGLGNLMTLPLLALTWAWGRGQDGLQLPTRIGQIALKPPWSVRCALGLAWLFEQSSSRLRARWLLWTHPASRWPWAAWMVLMIFIIFLPVPLGNVLPSLSLVLLALAWDRRDGLVMAGAWLVGLAAVVYTVVLWQLTWLALQAGWSWLSGWLGWP